MSVAMACGEGSGNAHEAAADENLDVNAGEENFPEIQLDSVRPESNVDSLFPADAGNSK